MNTRHLHSVALPSPESAQVLKTREEIIEWTAARRAVLAALLEHESLVRANVERRAA